MSFFDLEAFVREPTVEVLVHIRKQDWINIATFYEIPYNPRARKEVIKNVVIERLVNLEVLSADAIDALTPCASSGDQTPKGSLLPQLDFETPPLENENQTPPGKEKTVHVESITDQRTPQQYQLEYDIQLKRLEMEERIVQHNAQIAQQKLELEERLAQQKLEMEKDLRLREVELKEVQAKQDLEMKG